MATKQRLVKFCFYCKRKNDLTEDEFHEHWTVKHRALVSEWLIKYGIVKYTQYHTHSSAYALAAEQFPGVDALPKQEFDAIAEFVMPDVSCFYKATQDPYYKEVISPDEHRLFDWDTAKWSVGWEEVYVEDGKVVDAKN